MKQIALALSISVVAAAFAPSPSHANDELDPFLVPVQAEPSQEELDLQRRHRMLQWHQGFGYATLGLLTTQVALGWTLFGKYKSPRSGFTAPGYDQIRQAHYALGILSWTSYMTGASLSLFAPKIDNKDADDTVTTHRRLAWVHGIGMGLMPVWGWLISERRNELLSNGRYDAVAASHGAVATATWGALVGAYITVALR